METVYLPWLLSFLSYFLSLYLFETQSELPSVISQITGALSHKVSPELISSPECIFIPILEFSFPESNSFIFPYTCSWFLPAWFCFIFSCSLGVIPFFVSPLITSNILILKYYQFALLFTFNGREVYWWLSLLAVILSIRFLHVFRTIVSKFPLFPLIPPNLGVVRFPPLRLLAQSQIQLCWLRVLILRWSWEYHRSNQLASSG